MILPVRSGRSLVTAVVGDGTKPIVSGVSLAVVHFVHIVTRANYPVMSASLSVCCKHADLLLIVPGSYPGATL